MTLINREIFKSKLEEKLKEVMVQLFNDFEDARQEYLNNHNMTDDEIQKIFLSYKCVQDKLNSAANQLQSI